MLTAAFKSSFYIGSPQWLNSLQQQLWLLCIYLNFLCQPSDVHFTRTTQLSKPGWRWEVMINHVCAESPLLAWFHGVAPFHQRFPGILWYCSLSSSLQLYTKLDHMRPSCFPFLSHENTIEGNMLLQQPQLLKSRVNMSFVTLPSLCKLTASGSAQSCTFIRITKSQEIQVQNWCSRKREFLPRIFRGMSFN